MNQLTNRQIKIIDLMCSDFKMKEIAQQIDCSVSLVENELYWIREFYCCSTNTAVVFKHLTNYSNEIKVKTYYEN